MAERPAGERKTRPPPDWGGWEELFERDTFEHKKIKQLLPLEKLGSKVNILPFSSPSLVLSPSRSTLLGILPINLKGLFFYESLMLGRRSFWIEREETKTTLPNGRDENLIAQPDLICTPSGGRVAEIKVNDLTPYTCGVEEKKHSVSWLALF